MSSITDPEVRAFLTEGTRTGKLSFLSPSGHPLVTPVWFVLEGDTVVFNTDSDTARVMRGYAWVCRRAGACP